MTTSAKIAAAFLLAILLTSFASSLLPGMSYSEQHRDAVNAAPSARFPLGTDGLGRNRFARLLHATQISLLLAAAASIGTLTVAFLVGGSAGYFGGWCEQCLVQIIDLMLAVPWLLLLLAVRALLPLNASPLATLLLTYSLLAALGWAAPARVVRSGVRGLRDSGFILQARAGGSTEWRILRQILPNLKPVLMAQFWTSLPVFVLSEANLGFLGLSASEPFPTWGSLLRELQNPLALRPEAFAPAAAIALTLLCCKLVTPWGGTQV